MQLCVIILTVVINNVIILLLRILPFVMSGYFRGILRV